MGPDRRIADYISANRGKFTREAITQQLLDSGYEQGAIDATWAVLDAPDPDDVVGEGFWGRFWIYLIGLNVVAFLLVSVATQMIPNGVGFAVSLGVVLAIGAAIALGIVALIHPTRLGRGTAIAIGGIVPLIFTFLIAGSCYALVASLGPLPPPPLSGTLTVQIDPPLSLEATGAASCQQPPSGESYFNVYTDRADQLEPGPRQRLRRLLSAGRSRRAGSDGDHLLRRPDAGGRAGPGLSAGHRPERRDRARARLHCDERLPDLRGLLAGRGIRRAGTASRPLRRGPDLRNDHLDL